MDTKEIIRRLEKIAKHAVHTPGETPFIMSLDDGIALGEAVEMLKKQEPTGTEEYEGIYYCLGCKETVLKNDNFCVHCGRPINWYNEHMI